LINHCVFSFPDRLKKLLSSNPLVPTMLLSIPFFVFKKIESLPIRHHGTH
jgi:hypothetical protein